MASESSDPRRVDVLVVHADDVVAALAATAQGRETVLRVTPPFRGRQRARIHVVEGVDGAERRATGRRSSDGAEGQATGRRSSDGAEGQATDRRSSDGAGAESAASGEPLHVPADAFVSDAAPSFPRAPETEPTPAESPEYDVDEHFERHEDAVADWRATVPEHFQERVRVDHPDEGRCEFEVRYLGG